MKISVINNISSYLLFFLKRKIHVQNYWCRRHIISLKKLNKLCDIILLKKINKIVSIRYDFKVNTYM